MWCRPVATQSVLVHGITGVALAFIAMRLSARLRATGDHRNAQVAVRAGTAAAVVSLGQPRRLP